jgi:hypothetical protein
MSQSAAKIREARVTNVAGFVGRSRSSGVAGSKTANSTLAVYSSDLDSAVCHLGPPSCLPQSAEVLECLRGLQQAVADRELEKATQSMRFTPPR